MEHAALAGAGYVKIDADMDGSADFKMEIAAERLAAFGSSCELGREAVQDVKSNAQRVASVEAIERPSVLARTAGLSP